MDTEETHEITPAMERSASDAIASFAGLVLKRLQEDIGMPGELENDKTYVTVADLNKIFGEALQQYSA